jgi:hypothetical protein
MVKFQECEGWWDELKYADERASKTSYFVVQLDNRIKINERLRKCY